MKIIEINSEELQINSSGVGTLVFGLLFAAIGVSIASWGYLTQVDTNRWMSVAVGVSFVLGGAAVLFTAASRRVVLHRIGESEVTKKKLITKKTTSIRFTTDQIASVNFETHTEYDRTTDRDGDTHETPRRASSIRVLLKDTTEIMLATARGGSGFSINGMNLSEFSRAPLYDEAVRIASFYGVPLSTNVRSQDSIAGIAQIASTVKNSIDAAAPQYSVVAQPRPATLITQPEPALGAISQPVQSIIQDISPGVSEATVHPSLISAASPATILQRPQSDSPLQVPPRN